MAAPATAQDKPVALKLSSWVPAQHPLNPSLIAWAEDIKKDTVLKSLEQKPKHGTYDIDKEADLAPALPAQAGKKIWLGIKK